MRADGQLLAAKSLRVARLDLDDRGPRGRADLGPGHGNAADRFEQILGRGQRIDRAHQQDAGQDIADLDQLGAVDRRIHVGLGQVGGRLFFDRLIHDRIQAGRISAKEQKIHQRVFQRRPAALNRLRGVDRVDAVQHQGQQLGDQVSRGPRDEHRQKERPPPEAQPPGYDPMVEDRRHKKVNQRAGRQQHQAAGNVDRAHAAARLAQLIVDKTVELDHLAAGARRCAGLSAAAGPRSWSL